MVDYADIICQAVDEIVSKRLESINYDNTITCSVVDASKAKTGTYTVTDGSTNFTAYSVSTEYKVNDVVYVTIPNNDFTRQKIIIGKQVTRDTTPFIFTTPFDTIVDVSTNLITDDVGMRSLIANNPDTPPQQPTENEYILHQNIKKLVWEKDFEDSMIVGFTRLGIQGQFRSWLKSYQTKDGDYGYRLILTCEKDSHETTIQTAKRVIKKLSEQLNETVWGEIQTSDEIAWPDHLIKTWDEYNSLSSRDQDNFTGQLLDHLKGILTDSYSKYELYLSSADMYGDPYNFQSFYQQEKVYDISGLGKIINMKLEFYQTPESFISSKISNQAIYDRLTPDIDGLEWVKIQEDYDWPDKYKMSQEEFLALPAVSSAKLISNMKNHLCLVPYSHPLFGTLLDPNLFDQDPYICVGYDLGSFSEEQLIMYTLDASTYRAGLTEKENTKQAQLRWIHEFDDGTIKAISNETDPDFDFEVRWYRYELGHPTIDGYAGVNWKRVNQDEHIEVDLTKITTNMKNYYLIYHDDPNYSRVNEAYYATGLRVPYKNGRTYTLYDETAVLKEADFDWLVKHDLDRFENNGFIDPNYGMSTINLNMDIQSWTNIFKCQCIYHDSNYNLTDSFTGKRYTGQGCLHRVGFWELFTMGYLMYQYCQKEYDLLRVSSIWKTGGTESPRWTQQYANRNLYTDLGCTWPGAGDTTSNRNKIKTILHEFANSFGEWHRYVDPEDGWVDYRPVNEDVYIELYAACMYLYEKTQTPEYDYIAPNFSYTFLPDIEEMEEKVKAVIIFDGKPIYSNILTFTNERFVSNPATLDQINGLNLWCADDSYGNYRLYNIGGYLENEDDRNHIRDLECHFNSKEVEAQGLLNEASWIMWRIPASSTMIQVTASEQYTSFDYNKLDTMTKFIDVDTIDWRTKVPFSIAGTKYFDGIWSDYLYDADTDEIVSIWKGNSANGFFINPILEYKIKSFYSPSDSNNTITCVVYKDGVQYETQKEFTFGPVGNSGTDWSFEIDIDNNETALTSGNEKTITLTARLYDHTNRDVTEDMLYDVDLNASLKWEWHADSVNPSKLTLVQDRNKKHKCSISIPENTTISMESLLYVQCTTSGVGDYPLTAILPIPIRKWISDQKHYSHVTGATYVTYPSSGYPTYYNNPFKVHITRKTDSTSLTQEIEKDGKWRLYNPHDESEVYVGNISDKNILKPAAVYTQGVKQYGLQYSYNNEICWTQPIFTMQNNYPSRAINEWNGKEIKMDYDKGIIMSPAMAAGKKNDDNTFSGVMLGDWSVDDVEGDLKQQTGIYGFDHGAMSYAFKEDGTAFIGKSGFARIKFDGSESTIASESYTAGNYGMMIDLDDGFIDILGGHLKKLPNGDPDLKDLSVGTDDNKSGVTLKKKQYDPTGAKIHIDISGDPYFRIVADDTHRNTTLVEVSNTEYYLQTWDFNNTAGQEKGMKLDLMDTSLVAYNFTLESTGYGIGYDPDPAEGTSTRGQIHVRLSTEDEDYFFIGKNALSTDKDSSVETIKGVRVKPLIKINEDEFLLQSYNFGNVNNNESGMQIDLTNGSISAYNFTLESKGSDGVRVRLSTQDEPYFLISNNDKSLFEIGDGTFFMQSDNFEEEEEGMYIDLEDGSIYAYNFTLESIGNDVKIRLSTKEEAYFLIENEEPLIYIGDGEFYLQSNNYGNSSGMKIDLDNGSIIGYNFTLEGVGDDAEVRISTQDSPNFLIKKSQPLIQIGDGDFYLQTDNFSSSAETGMKIDLENGDVIAYQFYLEAGSGENKIYLNSEADTYPLQIGQSFKVSWAGVMESAGATINTANIDKANITNAVINTATLSGQLTGTNWNIDSSGKATFGNWSFNGSTLSHSAGGYITSSSGEFLIYCSSGISLMGDTTVLGTLTISDIGNLKTKLDLLEDKIDEVVEENKSLKRQLQSALEDAEYWEDRYNSHSCPDPEPSGGGSGTGGSE